MESGISSPKFTVITITYNVEEHLQHTIKSLVSQVYKDFEFIVIDGGSNDDTLTIIQNHQDIISKWISEPDDGISDAMNKGLSLASGEWIFFLHADDYLLDPESLEKVYPYLQEDCDILSFRLYYEKNQKIIETKPPRWDWTMLFKTGLYHQAVFCRKQLFERIGIFDKGLKIAMDYDFFLRAYLAKSKVLLCPEFISVMRKTGISSRLDWPSLKHRFAEEQKIHYHYANGLFMRLIYSVYWALYVPYRRGKYCFNILGSK